MMWATFVLVNDRDGGANAGKVVEPFCCIIGEVDATATHRIAEVVVPVCPVNGIALVEVQYPFYIR